jgi:DNA-binding Lrp family transcriptional regulator
MPKTVTLDSFDRSLLEIVRRDNQVPARVLAERIGLSESAVLRRLRALRREGIIAADVSIVSAEALGLALSMHVLVTMEREGSPAIDAFVRRLKTRAEVRRAWQVTGDMAFVLWVQVPSMEAYGQFTRDVFHDNPDVRFFRTLITIREVVGEGDAALPPLAD